MTTCGAGWKKKDKNGNPYISFSIDEPLFPLVLDEKKRLAAYPVKEKKSEKSPDFILDIYTPKEKPSESQNEDEVW